MLIESLRAQVAHLQAKPEVYRNFCLLDRHSAQPTSDSQVENVHSEASSSQPSSVKPDSMIARLCGGQRQLYSDRIGRLRFLGPTSSLHLMENVTSLVLVRESGGLRCPVTCVAERLYDRSSGLSA
jgi:hypothetical protein